MGLAGKRREWESFSQGEQIMGRGKQPKRKVGGSESSAICSRIVMTRGMDMNITNVFRSI